MKRVMIALAFVLIAGAAYARNVVCAKDGNCPRCQPGECMVWTEQVVSNSDYVYTENPSCDGNMDERVQQLVHSLADSQVPGISEYAGPLIDSATNTIVSWIKDNIGGTAGELLSPYTNPHASCAIVGVIVPKNAEVTGYSVYARHKSDPAEKCSPGNDCDKGWCQWTHDPITINSGSAKFVYSTFKNWSDTWQRGAKLEVFFKPPADWIPQR